MSMSDECQKIRDEIQEKYAAKLGITLDLWLCTNLVIQGAVMDMMFENRKTLSTLRLSFSDVYRPDSLANAAVGS